MAYFIGGPWDGREINVRDNALTVMASVRGQDLGEATSYRRDSLRVSGYGFNFYAAADGSLSDEEVFWRAVRYAASQDPEATARLYGGQTSATETHDVANP